MRPSFVWRTLKETTGLVGLAVNANPKPQLISLYGKILHGVQRVPPTSVYRQSVESITLHRLRIVEKEGSTVNSIETEIGGGQVEELIAQAEDELLLLNKMITDFKAWEDLEEPAPKGQWSQVTV